MSLSSSLPAKETPAVPFVLIFSNLCLSTSYSLEPPPCPCFQLLEFSEAEPIYKGLAEDIDGPYLPHKAATPFLAHPCHSENNKIRRWESKQSAAP